MSKLQKKKEKKKKKFKYQAPKNKIKNGAKSRHS